MSARTDFRTMGHILLVDDNTELLAIQRQVLIDAGHTVVTAKNGVHALREASEQAFDLVITDIIMPEKEGIEIIFTLRRAKPGLRIIAMSGGGVVGAESYLDIAKAFGAALTLEKPFNNQALLAAVGTVLAMPTK